jgi:hypothetical protein
MATEFRKEWGYVAAGALAVYLWMKANQAKAGITQPGLPIPLNLPSYVPCVIDPTTGDCVMQETPMPGAPIGVPNVNPGLLPSGWDPNTYGPPQLADASAGGGGSLPVVTGAPGTPGGALLLNP